MPTVSIIGTSGRREDAPKMTRELFYSMCKCASKIITNDLGLNWDKVTLVSAGAAWSDHVAVSLFLTKRPRQLLLYLPCDWSYDLKTPQFEDTGEKDWRTNPGGVCNYYHRQFSKVMGYNTLEEIQNADLRGAILNSDTKGFFNSDNGIVNSDYLISFSWSKGEPKSGGTLDTWKKAKGEKIHVCLQDL